MHITLCARSKMLHLLEPGGVFRVHASVLPGAGHHVDLIPNTEVVPTDCTIQQVPHVVADIQTATLLADQVVDFDYALQEFVITVNERSPHHR